MTQIIGHEYRSCMVTLTPFCLRQSLSPSCRASVLLQCVIINWTQPASCCCARICTRRKICLLLRVQ